MREETRKAIEGKFLYWLKFKDRRTGKTSAQYAAELLREIGVKRLTNDVVKAYLYNGFATMSYDITAVIEARGIPRKETLKLWKEFYKNNQKIINDWMKSAQRS